MNMHPFIEMSDKEYKKMRKGTQLRLKELEDEGIRPISNQQLWCVGCTKPLQTKVIGFKDVCIECGTVFIVDSKAVIYNELVAFINRYKIEDKKIKEIFRIWGIPQQHIGDKLRMIFTELGVKVSYANNFIRRCNKKIRDMYKTKEVVL